MINLKQMYLCPIGGQLLDQRETSWLTFLTSAGLLKCSFLCCSFLQYSRKEWPMQMLTPYHTGFGNIKRRIFCVGCPVSNVSTQLELQMCIQEPRIGTASCSSTPRIKVNIVLGGTLFH